MVFCVMWRKKKIADKRQDIVKRLDKVFSTYIRLRDSFVRDWVRWVQCPLCWSVISRDKSQCMHFIKRGIMKYRFDEMNCHAGCYRCNVVLHGNYIYYTRRMQMKYWLSQVDKMITDKQTYHWYNWELKDKINEYLEKIDEITWDNPQLTEKKKKLKQLALF